MILPLDKENTTFIAYSKNGRSGVWNVPDAAFEKAEIAEITVDGNILLGEASVCSGKINLDIKPGQALVIKEKKQQS